MPPSALTVPLPDWPVVGNYLPVAILFTVHILIAEYSLGAITLAWFMEMRGVRSGEERHFRYARALGNSYYLVFSLGATFAVFAVVAIVGLWGTHWGVLMNRFFSTIAIAFGLFLVLAPLLVWWRNSFGRMRAGRHALLGFAVLFWQTLFMVLIVEIDAFNLTPARTGLLASTLNPAYIPLLLHRLIGNVSWTALFLAGFAVLRMARAADEGERWFQSWAARVNLRIGVITGIAMPVIGFALVETFKQTQPGVFANLVQGETAYLFIIQSALLAVLFVASNLALAYEDAAARGGPDLLGRAAVGLSALGFAAGLLPSQALPGNAHWARYAGIGLGLLVTLLHVLARTTPRRQRLALRTVPAPGASAVLPYATPALARRAVVAAGIVSMGLAAYMGYMKEQSRNPYSVYGELTQQQAHGQWNPQGIYP